MADEGTGEGEGPGEVEAVHTAWSPLPTARYCHCGNAVHISGSHRCWGSREDRRHPRSGLLGWKDRNRERRAKVPGDSASETGRRARRKVRRLLGGVEC